MRLDPGGFVDTNANIQKEVLKLEQNIFVQGKMRPIHVQNLSRNKYDNADIVGYIAALSSTVMSLCISHSCAARYSKAKKSFETNTAELYLGFHRKLRSIRVSFRHLYD